MDKKQRDHDRGEKDGSKADGLTAWITQNFSFESKEYKEGFDNGLKNQPKHDSPNHHESNRDKSSDKSDSSIDASDSSSSYESSDYDYSGSESYATSSSPAYTSRKSGLSGSTKLIIWTAIAVVVILIFRALWSVYDVSTLPEGSTEITVLASKGAWKWIILHKATTSYQVYYWGDQPKQARWIKLTSYTGASFTITAAQPNEVIRRGEATSSLYQGNLLEYSFPPAVNQIHVFCPPEDSIFVEVPPQIRCLVRGTGQFNITNQIEFLGNSLITVKVDQ